MENLILPKVVFGTSALGNLYQELSAEKKTAIIAACFQHAPGPVVFDSAGKYGAGLALEVLGQNLAALNIAPNDVIISNKLGWYRTALTTPEPLFEPGVWKGLKHDAVQRINYAGILECYEQGIELLKGYPTHMVSVHDPDEYLAAANGKAEQFKRYEEILDAYVALENLKAAGKVKAIGVGAKNWRTIARLAKDVKLDWVMIANSYTIKEHPPELLAFMQELQHSGVSIINSAVFQAGFLVGGAYYDYKLIQPEDPAHREKFEWRKEFFALCEAFNIKPAEACVQFGLNAPGVISIALNTTEPKRVKENIALASTIIPDQFWQELKAKKLLQEDYAYL